MNILTTPGTPGRDRDSHAAIVRRAVAISALALALFGLRVSAASAGESETISTKGGPVAVRDKGERLVAWTSAGTGSLCARTCRRRRAHCSQ